MLAGGVVASLPTPMAWFTMAEVEGAGTVIDASGNGRNLTLGANVQIVDTERYGKALKFSGTTADWARFSCPAVTNTTISFWLNRDAQDSSITNASGTELNTIPYFLNTGYSGFGINYGRNTENISFINQANNPQSNFLAFDVLARLAWHHVAIIVEHIGTDTVSGFEILKCTSCRDGYFYKSIVWTNNAAMRTGTQTATIGNSGAGGNRPISGLMADIRFYDQALTPAQVVQVASEGGGAGAPELVMHWAFDEMTANEDGTFTTPEATGSGATMTLGENMTLVDDGVIGKALCFRGTSGLGGRATSIDRPIYEYTATCWVRRSSQAHLYDALVDNPYPRLFDSFTSSGGGGYCIFEDLAGNGKGFSLMPAGAGTTFKARTWHALSDVDVWSHLAMVTRYITEGADAGKGIIDFYVNGEPVHSYDLQAVFNLVPVQAGRTFWVGNASGGYNANRYFCGELDDFRIYDGALSANEVRRIYRGLAAISAGPDFTVTGDSAVLAGTVGNQAEGTLRKGYAGTTAWSLVSAPEGGEGAAILQPEATLTSVTLPVAGEYVFRLTISDLGASMSDDVAVTRVVEDTANTAPTVSLAAMAAVTLPAPLELTATVSDDGRPAPAALRTRWTKKSGPGGVWFEPADAVSTKAYFSVGGTYVLTCYADDGQAQTASDVTVTVADAADGDTLTNGLTRCWTLEGHALPFGTDAVTGTPLSSAPDYVTRAYLPGRLGNGIRCMGAYLSYFNTGLSFAETKDPAMTQNWWPVEQYQTISAWIKIDSTDTNEVLGANILMQPYTLGIRYNETGTSAQTGGFCIHQQGALDTGGINIGWARYFYPAPTVSPVDRWMHICAVVDRREGLDMEMWYDGVKQTRLNAGSARGRVNGNKILLGGHDKADGNDYNGCWTNSVSGGFYSRTFPGVIDEVRIWTRKLSEGEIRYLAANPVIDPNRAPTIDVPDVPPRMVEKRVTAVAAAVFDDALPTGSVLTYAWSVLSDNASDAVFGDASARETTFTAYAAGTYKLQLVVSDGERTTYSRICTVDVSTAGTLIRIR